MDEVTQTQLISIDPEHPELATLQHAAGLLNSGRLVAFPTETVYGLGANALDRNAVARIFAAKGRPSSDPLIVHLYSIAQLEEIATNIPAIAWDLAHRFWPGPLTLVLPKTDRVPDNVSAGLETVAVRMPNYPIAYELLKLGDLAVAAPSANLFARPSPTTAQHVWDDLHGRVDLILDGGPTTIGVESTVLDLTGDTPTILRPGGLPKEALVEVIPNVVYTPRYAALDEAALPGPGMLTKHYSPSVELRLFTGPQAAVLKTMQNEVQGLQAEGRSVGVMVAAEDVARFASLDANVVSLGPGEDLTQIAQNLFAGMRQLERADVDIILTRTFGKGGLGLAIWDRLLRATEGQIIEVEA